MPKYVVSSAAEQPARNNSTVLKGDVVTEVAALKRELGGDIVVYASRLLVQPLIEHDLIDELRLTVHPVVPCEGERLFGDTSDKSQCACSAPGRSVTASPTSPTTPSRCSRREADIDRIGRTV
jgi:dihydrofolate reductase